MNINYYLGLPYDFRNIDGVNCWGLYALIRHNEFGDNIKKYSADKCTNRSISSVFTAEMTKGDHKHKQVDNPKDFDLILLSIMDAGIKKYHCGIYYKGGMIHAKGTGRNGQVWYDELKEYKNWKIRYFRYENK